MLFKDQRSCLSTIFPWRQKKERWSLNESPPPVHPAATSLLWSHVHPTAALKGEELHFLECTVAINSTVSSLKMNKSPPPPPPPPRARSLPLSRPG